MKITDLKNKKELMFALFATGVLLLAVSKTDIARPEKPQSTQVSETLPDIEKRLENALSTVEGVGEVKVLIYYGDGGQKIIAKDKTEERDGDKKHFEEKTVLTDQNEPVILQENTRRTEGVLIIAQGGADPKTRAALISAAQALLGIEAHKIEVLKMK